VIIGDNADSNVGDQRFGGNIFIFGTINIIIPGFTYVKDAGLLVDGIKAKGCLK
jgi:formylmethanofuran dehydrogenase subunit C